MKSQRIASEGAVDTLVVILDNGEEAFSTLQNYARQEEISAASLTAIGAFGPRHRWMVRLRQQVV